VTVPARPPGVALGTASPSPWSARVLARPRCTRRRPRGRARREAAPASKATHWPLRRRSWRPQPPTPVSRWPGLGARPAPSRASPTRGTGPASGTRWWPCAGCLSMLPRVRLVRSLGAPPLESGLHPSLSRALRHAGRSRLPSRKVAKTSSEHPRRVMVRQRSDASRPVDWASRPRSSDAIFSSQMRCTLPWCAQGRATRR
jgi:hypothetical protein